MHLIDKCNELLSMIPMKTIRSITLTRPVECWWGRRWGRYWSFSLGRSKSSYRDAKKKTWHWLGFFDGSRSQSICRWIQHPLAVRALTIDLKIWLWICLNGIDGSCFHWTWIELNDLKVDSIHRSMNQWIVLILDSFNSIIVIVMQFIFE